MLTQIARLLPMASTLLHHRIWKKLLAYITTATTSSLINRHQVTLMALRRPESTVAATTKPFLVNRKSFRFLSTILLLPFSSTIKRRSITAFTRPEQTVRESG